MAHATEIEWQLDVRDLAALRRWLVGQPIDGWSVVPGRVLVLRDAYFDTADWRMWRAGYAFRVRRSALADSAE